MPLVNSNILGQLDMGNTLGAAQQGINMGQGLIQFGQQQQAQKRQQAFSDALDEVVTQAGDFTQPEAHAKIIQGLQAKGFGQEAMEIEKQLQGLQPKDAGTDNVWADLPGAAQPTLFNKKTAETKLTGIAGKPEKAPPEKFQLVKNDKGKMESVDVSTGLNSKGQPVKAWQDPEKPLGGAVLLGSYLRDFSKSRFDYEKSAKPYVALKSIVESPSYGTGVGDQSMIDKIIMIETGKVPTEAQYFQFAQNLGFADKIDKVTGKLKSGAILGPEARKLIEAQADEQMKSSHDAYLEELAQAKGMASDAGVDPKKVIRTGGYFNEVDKRLNKKAAGAPAVAPKADPAKVAKAKAYMALPPDSPYRTPAHDAAAKAILGIQ